MNIETDERVVMAKRFTELGRRFKPEIKTTMRFITIESAGNLLIEAFRKGYLDDLDGLADLVEYHTTDTGKPIPRSVDEITERSRSSIQLWYDLVVESGSPGLETEDRVIFAPRAGLLQTLYPSIFTPIVQHPDTRDDDHLSRMSAACDVLADLIGKGITGPVRVGISLKQAKALMLKYNYEKKRDSQRQGDLYRWAKHDPDIRIGSGWDANRIILYMQNPPA